MLRYVARRLVFTIPILIGVSIVVFGFVRALPGGPGAALLGERATASDVEAIERQLGLDRPIHVQYVSYMRKVLKGDLGITNRSRLPVLTELGDRFPATVELGLAAIMFALIVGVPLGFLAAKRYQGVLDQSSLFLSLIGISFPVFFLAIILKYIFAVKLHWLPTIGRMGIEYNIEHPTNFYLLDALIARDWGAFVDVVKHLILPAIALGTIPLAIVARITRAAVLDVMSEDYVRTANAKGLAPGVVDRRHILRNSLLPVVTVVGLQTGLLLTGAILTETIFSWPGVGGWMLDAIGDRDYAILQGGIIFFALLIVIVNLLVDISYAFLNPKIRYR